MIQTGGNEFLTASFESDLGILSKDSYSNLDCVGLYFLNGISGSSISIDGLALYQDCPDVLSLPYKKGLYSSDDLDIFAEDNIHIEGKSGDVDTVAGGDITEDAGGDIAETAGGTASTDAEEITHN